MNNIVVAGEIFVTLVPMDPVGESKLVEMTSSAPKSRDTFSISVIEHNVSLPEKLVNVNRFCLEVILTKSNLVATKLNALDESVLTTTFDKSDSQDPAITNLVDSVSY